MTLSDAWTLWLGGGDLRTQELWGLSVAWWGRIGKVIQFIAVVLGAIEIAGAARISQFFATLSGHRWWTTYAPGLLVIGFVVAWMSLFVFVLRRLPQLLPRDSAIMQWIASIPQASTVITVALMFLALVLAGLLAAIILILVDRMPGVAISKRVHTIAQLALLVLFVLGFHFDLLSS